MRRLHQHFLCLLIGMVVAATAGRGFIVSPPERLAPLPQFIPVDRLLANASRRVREQPDSAEAHYVVARLNYLVFSTGWTMVADGEEVYVRWDGRESEWHVRRHRAIELAYDDVGAVGAHIAESKRAAFQKARDRRFAQLNQSGWTAATSLPRATMARHAAEALDALETAARLAPANVHYLLCRACLIEQFVEWRAVVKPATLPPKLEHLEREQARELYLAAFNVGFQKSGDQQGHATGADAVATVEAGQNFVRLSKDAKAGAALGSSTVAEVEQGLKLARKWPENDVIQLITPIILAVAPVRGVDDLLDPAAGVVFPLRGYGPVDRWPWVRPATGFLVWDPQVRGEITSGRQLFGGYTFQIFRANGYDALAALDDDGDGVLRGAELDGIRVWFDRDGDGHSTPEEVVDLASLGIVALAVRATATDGIHPTNPAGVIFSDGRTLPTWDWMVAPHRN